MHALPRRGYAAAAAVALALATAPVAGSTPASAAATSTSAGPVGGPALSSRGFALPPGTRLPSGITASAFVLADLDTGAVLAARDAHGRYAPASTIKMLTAVTLIPAVPKRTMVQVTNDDAAVDGSKVGIVPGAKYPAQDLFGAMLVVSGNDAASALAAAGPGGRAGTVAAMNRTAQQLQAYDTVARTPSGLDFPGQTSSAYDLALIARAGLELPDFRYYVAVKRSFLRTPGRRTIEIYTHNRLLRNYAGAIGVKNGYTVAAKASFVGAAVRGKRRLVVALMHGTPRVWHEAAALLDWGFSLPSSVAAVGQLVDPLPASGGSQSTDPAVGSSPTPVPAADAGPAAAPASLQRTTGWGWRRQAALSLGTVVGTGLLLAFGGRHRRRRRRSRLSLPAL